MKTPIEIKKVDKKNGIFIFTFYGELDETNVNETFKSLINEIWDFSNNIIFNFKWLEYINSKTIWYLANIYSGIDENQKKMYISNCNEWIKDTLDLVWITNIIPTVLDESEAIKLINESYNK